MISGGSTYDADEDRTYGYDNHHDVDELLEMSDILSLYRFDSHDEADEPSANDSVSSISLEVPLKSEGHLLYDEHIECVSQRSGSDFVYCLGHKAYEGMQLQADGVSDSFIEYLAADSFNDGYTDIDEKEGKAVMPLLYALLSCFLREFSASQKGMPKDLQAIQLQCLTWTAKPLSARQLAAWQAFDNVAKEVKAPQSVDTLFDDELIAENEHATTAALDFTLIDKKVQRTFAISFRNVADCAFRFYLADPELLFSASPFSWDSDNAKMSAVSPTPPLANRTGRAPPRLHCDRCLRRLKCVPHHYVVDD